MPSVIAILHATIAELRAVIVDLRATIARLEERVRDLETRVGQHSGNSSRDTTGDPATAHADADAVACGRRSRLSTSRDRSA